MGKPPSSSTPVAPQTPTDDSVAASLRKIQTMASTIVDENNNGGGLRMGGIGVGGGGGGGGGGGRGKDCASEARDLAVRLSSMVEDCAIEAESWRYIPTSLPPSLPPSLLDRRLYFPISLPRSCIAFPLIHKPRGAQEEGGKGGGSSASHVGAQRHGCGGE